MSERKAEYRKIILQAIKIGIGSSFSFWLAGVLQLDNAASAGIVALLTIVTTKKETLYLSLYRVISFFISAVLAMVLIQHIPIQWLDYGIFVLVMVFICSMLNMKATISVNAVVGTHFMMQKDYSAEFIMNEFAIIAIGISAAIVLNLFQGNKSVKQQLAEEIKETERQLSEILFHLAAYLSDTCRQGNVWDELSGLEKKLKKRAGMAYEYEDNLFYRQSSYYVDYFEMRLRQCDILHNLHNEMRKIRTLPSSARIVADYMMYLAGFITSRSVPEEQIQRLEELCEAMKQEELPATHEEFENSALLYHVLWDIEEYLRDKEHFINGLDDRQMKMYISDRA